MMDYVGDSFSVIDLPSLFRAHPELDRAYDALASALHAASDIANLHNVDLTDLDEITASFDADEHEATVDALAAAIFGRYQAFVTAVETTTGLEIYRAYVDADSASRYSEITGVFWAVSNAWMPTPAAAAARVAGVQIERQHVAVHC